MNNTTTKLNSIQQQAQILRTYIGDSAFQLGVSSAAKRLLVNKVFKEAKQSKVEIKPRKRTAFAGDIFNSIPSAPVVKRRTVKTMYPCIMYNINEVDSKGTALPIISWGWDSKEEVLKIVFFNNSTTYVYAYFKVREDDIKKVENYSRFWDFYRAVIKHRKKVAGLA